MTPRGDAWLAARRAAQQAERDAATAALERPDPPFRWTTARVEALRRAEIGERQRQARGRRLARQFFPQESDSHE